MTELAFHFGADDPVAYTCRLLRKAVATGARLVVRADAATRQRIDTQLWALSPTDFVAHCDVSASGAMRQLSPVLLAETSVAPPAPNAAPYTVLVNLSASMPESISPYARVIEVVGVDEADRQAARMRWKQYKAQGLTIAQHDLTGAKPA